MIRHRELWRSDFASLDPTERRAARFALQLTGGLADLNARLRDLDFLGMLWQLTLPLLDPNGVAALLASECDEDDDDDDDDGGRGPAGSVVARDGMAGTLRRSKALRVQLAAFYTSMPRWVLQRLVKQDGAAPLSSVTSLLGNCLTLAADELRILDFLDLWDRVDGFRDFLREFGARNARGNRALMAKLLDLPEDALAALLQRGSALRLLGLVQVADDQSDLEDALRPTDLLREVFNASPADVDGLLNTLVEPAPGAKLPLSAFAHMSADVERLRAVLGTAARTAASGVNALLFGAPGTGKTEFARTLAAACGLRAYLVRSRGTDGEALSREGRLGSYLVAQRLLTRRRDALLIFDEVEDVFEAVNPLLAWLPGSGVTGRHKGWTNRLLEENPVPAAWITNDTTAMDPAFLRRFLLPVAFVNPPRSVRQRIVECHLGDYALSAELLDELAADTALSPAQFALARRLVALSPDVPAERMVREGMGALRTLLKGAPLPRQRRAATHFDAAFLNLDGQISPSAIARALARRGEGSLCFYGVPGTGKTAFAEVLATALDRELVARSASDLISPLVGETEQNLARMFRESDPNQTVLLLDEVDSFLADRRQARHTWERTQVNELLQQMERFSGVFIAATNLIDGIDTAAMRRFDFKLRFRALSPVQRVRLFAREALGDEAASVPPEIARQLALLDTLTPGDFATVCRQRLLLDEEPTPVRFLHALARECRFKRT
ncbi:MAG: AAA family ATPase, partial [Thiotrichales bacterium]